MKPFESEEQFKQVIEQIFTLMNDNPDVGPKLNRAQAPHLFEFPDFGLRFHVTYTDAAEAEAGRYLKWTWEDDDCDWEPMIRLTMKGEVANKYFQGRENIPMAVATGRLMESSDMCTFVPSPYGFSTLEGMVSTRRTGLSCCRLT